MVKKFVKEIVPDSFGDLVQVKWISGKVPVIFFVDEAGEDVEGPLPLADLDVEGCVQLLADRGLHARIDKVGSDELDPPPDKVRRGRGRGPATPAQSSDGPAKLIMVGEG